MRDRTQLDILKRDRAAMDRALAEVGATRKGTAWKCPFHDDTNASAGIHEASDGTVLFTCKAAGCGWNNGNGSGDAIAVLTRGGKSFNAAVEFLGGSATHKTPAKTANRSLDSKYNERFANECSARLIRDEAAIAELWRTRAINREIAGRHEVGITQDGTFWTFTIRDREGKFVAVKGHRRSGDGPKSIWFTKGTKSTQLYPASMKLNGPTWLCPGEFKALAVISTGRNAVGITSGEDVALPVELADLLRGRIVAVAPDADKGGEIWLSKHVRPFCKEHGIELRVVDLGLDKEVGLKDIGDFIVREAVEEAREPEAIAATLDNRFDMTDTWQPFSLRGILDSPRTWEKVEHITSGFRDLDSAIGGLRTRAVHIFAGRTGRAKTQTVIAIATNAAIAGYPVGIISLELCRDEIARLIAAAQSRVSRTRLDEGQLTGAEHDRFQGKFHSLQQLPITVLDSDYWGPSLNRERLEEIVAAGVARFGWRVVALDYFNLLAPIESDRSEFQSDLLNSAALKRIAYNNRIAMPVVAGLRKPPPTRKEDKNKIPTLDEIAGAGRIAYDAVSVFYIDSKQYDSDPPSGIVELHPLKSRFSRAAHIGKPVSLVWQPGYGTIENGEFA